MNVTAASPVPEPMPTNAKVFDQWVWLPENRDRLFEFIGGQVREKVPVSPRLSQVAGQLAFRVNLHLWEHDQHGHVTGEGGGYCIGEERYVPDVAYLPVSKQEALDEFYNAVPPDLVAEVVSPGEDEDDLLIKITNYLAAGCLVWVVYSKPTRQVRVFAPGQKVRILNEDDVLDGGTVLPGFKITVRDLFETR